MADKKVELQSSAIVSLPQPPLAKAEDYLTAYNGYQYSAITSIADAVASIKLHLFKRTMTKKGVEANEIFEHPALSLLYYVNSQFTHFDLIVATQTYLDLIGEAFWIILRDGKEPAELWPVRPDWMYINPSKTSVVDSYTYRPGGNMTDKVVFPANDVIHFKYFNPKNPYRGKGSVQAGAMPIDIHTFSQEYNRNFFFNSAIPSMVFTTEQKLNEATIKRFMESWQSKFGGKQNSNKVAFLGGGMKADKVSQSAKEMDFAELQRMMRDDILAVFKVPKSIIGLTEDVNRANAEATTRNFMERVVTPRMIKYVAHLNEFYLNQWEDDIFFDFDDPAPEDTTLKLAIYQSGLSLGWLTRNEVREQENLLPVEGGDVLYIPFSISPIGEEPEDPNKPTGEDPDEDEDEDKKGLFSRFFKGSKKEYKPITLAVKKKVKKERKFMMPIPPAKLQDLAKKKLAGEIKVDLVKLINNLMTQGYKPTFKPKDKSTWPEKKREEHWKKLIAKTDVQEEKFRYLLRPLFNEQEDVVIRNIENLKYYAQGRKKGKESGLLFSPVAETKRWIATLTPFVKAVIVDKGNETLEFLGVKSITGGKVKFSNEFDFTEEVIAYIRSFGLDVVKQIQLSTLIKLRESLAEGIEKEEGIPELKNRVEEIYDLATGSRSELIARTEVLRASNFATEESYRQSGIVRRKEWLTAVDERVCPWCEDMDGKIIGTDDEFFEKGDSLTVNGKTLDFDIGDVGYPPLHPQCRCTLIPVL